MTNGNLEDAKGKIESLVIYLAKQKHFATQKLEEADKALSDATAVLVAVETEIAHPIVYVPPVEEQSGQIKSDTPIGDLASFGFDPTKQNLEPINLDK